MTIAPTIAARGRRGGGANSTPAVSASAAAVSTTPGAPSQLSSGMSARQPAAAPVRSAAYTALIREAIRAIASVTTRPPVKNGSDASA